MQQTMEEAVADYRQKVFEDCDANLASGLWPKIIVNDLKNTKDQIKIKEGMEQFVAVLDEAIEKYKGLKQESDNG